ncbi:MAG: M23 family metallopeptidase, partial [Bdellovibrionales bacterium]
VDFSREVRVRDRWRLTVEQKLVRGRPIGWGSILAAEYENAGELHTALLYQDGESSGYYGLDGSNLRRMFLKSPIKFGRISSRFNRKRFHPVLKIRRPHLGVDYAAARGTPIRSVGDGTVLLAGWKGGGGRTVKIRHNSTYQTSYLHMSGFAKGIKRGTRVKQGQIIGYVGATGLATGPHLHFEFSVNGKVVDPLKAKFPTADPIPKTKIASFKAQISGLLATLPGWDGLELAGRKPGASDSAVERSEDAGVSVTGESIN